MLQELRRDIDLIILDMIMPGMGGLECFHELKQLDPNVKVILNTGYGMNENIQDFLDEGGCGFLQKPYRLRNLAQAVHGAMLQTLT